jgi:hypothetical protein
MTADWNYSLWRNVFGAQSAPYDAGGKRPSRVIKSYVYDF